MRNYFYVGLMMWGNKQYPGTHELFITPQTFNQVQAILAGHNRPKYSKREVALRGLMTCAYDARGNISRERASLESRLAAIRSRMDMAYSDKLDGKIAEDFWRAKWPNGEWTNNKSRWRFRA